jgi:hypothetical protein
MGKYTDEVTTIEDALYTGDLKRVVDEVVIASGQVLSRGAVLGRITASNKFVLSLAAASDGSEVPRAILEEDVDATAGDKRAPAARTGEFNAAALTFGTGHNADSTRDGLRGLGIHLETVVA